VNLIAAPESSVLLTHMGASSPDGRLRAFDADANGYVRGEGGGMIVLKRLSQALADGDRVWCVIRGGAINHDGASNGLTAPNPRAQVSLLRDACVDAGVDPAQVHYVEAHGTGTPIGDPIEAEALGAVYGRARSGDQHLMIGSVKSGIGHLEAAAGIAGLIKVALAMHERSIPPSLNFVTPNPSIPFDEWRLRVVTRLEAWPDGRPLAGVSSFGFGGGNSHVIVEGPQPSEMLVRFAAPSPEALAERVRVVCDALGPEQTPVSLADICELARGDGLEGCERLAVVASTAAELRRDLQAFRSGRPRANVIFGRARTQRPTIVFVFSGQGSEWRGSARDLLEREPVFRTAIERCDAHLRAWMNWSLLEELARDPSGERADAFDEQLGVSLVAMAVGLTELWRSRGVTPDLVVGHSICEVAAAFAAGLLDLEDAMRVAYALARVGTVPGERGGLALVEMSRVAVEQALGDERRLSVAVENGPASVVVGGAGEPLEAFVRALEAKGVRCRRGRVAGAPHTPLIEPVLDELRAALATIKAPAETSARATMISTVTAQPVSGPLDAEYWVTNARSCVRLGPALDRAVADGGVAFVQICAHPVHAGSVLDALARGQQSGRVIHSMRRGEPPRRVLLEAAAALFVDGVALADSPTLEPLEAPARPELLTLSASGEQTGRRPGSGSRWTRG
jgi:acyl transferase domain-containing protein